MRYATNSTYINSHNKNHNLLRQMNIGTLNKILINTAKCVRSKNFTWTYTTTQKRNIYLKIYSKNQLV